MPSSCVKALISQRPSLRMAALVLAMSPSPSATMQAIPTTSCTVQARRERGYWGVCGGMGAVLGLCNDLGGLEDLDILSHQYVCKPWQCLHVQASEIQIF